MTHFDTDKFHLFGHSHSLSANQADIFTWKGVRFWPAQLLLIIIGNVKATRGTSSKLGVGQAHSGINDKDLYVFARVLVVVVSVQRQILLVDAVQAKIGNCGLRGKRSRTVSRRAAVAVEIELDVLQ